MRSAAPQKFRSGNALRNPIMKSLTSSRPRRGACREYCSSMSSAASSSMMLGFQGLPQNPPNQRPTMALLSCSRDITGPPMLWLKACPPSDEASLSRGPGSLISASCGLIPRSANPNADVSFAGEQHGDVERHREWLPHYIERRGGNVPRVGTHQDRSPNCRRVENRTADQPHNGRGADKTTYHFAITTGCVVVLAHQPEAVPEFGHMIRARIGHGEPASGAKHARCLGEVLRRKNADEEVDGGVLHR